MCILTRPPSEGETRQDRLPFPFFLLSFLVWKGWLTSLSALR